MAILWTWEEREEGGGPPAAAEALTLQSLEEEWVHGSPRGRPRMGPVRASLRTRHTCVSMQRPTWGPCEWGWVIQRRLRAWGEHGRHLCGPRYEVPFPPPFSPLSTVWTTIDTFHCSQGLKHTKGPSLVAQPKRICLPNRRPGFKPWAGKIPWRRKWQPTPVILLGKSYGQRSLVGYSPWGHKWVRNDWATKEHHTRRISSHGAAAHWWLATTGTCWCERATTKSTAVSVRAGMPHPVIPQQPYETRLLSPTRNAPPNKGPAKQSYLPLKPVLLASLSWWGPKYGSDLSPWLQTAYSLCSGKTWKKKL